MTDRYAVMGNPIAHSKSPRIHTLFAAQTNQDLRYEAMLVEPGHFPSAVRVFSAQGGKGLNITVPFKPEAFAIADTVSERARRAGVVNTLSIAADGGLAGDNTDGIGLVRDLTANLGLVLQGRRVLILGAGGAVAGILGPLLDERPERVVIANRTAHKAHDLARQFPDQGNVEGIGLDALAQRRFDLVLHGTAAGLSGDLPPLPDDLLEPGGACYDLFYADRPTPFVAWGQMHGAALCADGLGMLVEQAAESFRIWRGVRPDTQKVIAALRNPAPRLP